MAWEIAAWILAALCLAWWATAATLVHSLRTVERLADLPLVERPAWPSLTAIVPARNEAGTIEDAMRRRLADDYPGLEVLIVDDRSDDDTGRIAERLAAADGRVRVVHNETLPPGWLGKVHALDLGARRARGDWLLLSDADVELAPGTLRRTVERCESGGFDVLAALPTFRPTGIVIAALYSMMLRVLYAALRPRATENPRSSHGVGVGAFTLVRRRALEASPGFAALRLEVADDLMLGRMLKRSGARCTAVDGAGAVTVELYRRTADFVRGAEKNAWAVSAGFSLARGLVVALLFLAVELAPLGLLAVAPTPWLRGFAAATALVAFAASAGALRANRQPWWPGLLYPVGSLLFCYAALRGTLLGWKRGGLPWRDTFYPTRVFLEFRRERREAWRRKRESAPRGPPS